MIIPIKDEEKIGIREEEIEDREWLIKISWNEGLYGKKPERRENVVSDEERGRSQRMKEN